MPKMKTNRSASKRFKVTGKGRVKRRHAFKSHILTKKAPKRKRQLRHSDMTAKGDEKRVLRMLGLGG